MKPQPTERSLQVCESPFCEVKFQPTCLPWKGQRYCSGACRMDVYAIGRVAKLYGLSVEELHKALKVEKYN
jgi:hypothetical protein